MHDHFQFLFLRYMVNAMTKPFSQALSQGSIWAAAISKGASCPPYETLL